MRTTLEIVGAVERGEWASPEELRMALMVAEAVSRVATHHLDVIAGLADTPGWARERAEETRDGLVRAMRRDPADLAHPEELFGPGLSEAQRVRLAVGREAGY